MYELSIRGDIAAAHFLRGYEGKCKDLHGHTWQVEVTIKDNQLNDIGMVADFCKLKVQLKEFLSQLDHVCLNDLDYFKEKNPTTENISRFIFDGFGQLVSPLKIERVRVWESETSSVTYYE